MGMQDHAPAPHRMIESLEQARALDAAAETIGRVLQAALAEESLRDALSGRWLGHAVHPLLTDLPIGAWTSSVILDLLGGASAESAADLLIGVGVLAVAPTALTGWSDWSEASVEQQRVGLVHAAANITAAVLFSVSLSKRRSGHRKGAKLVSLLGVGSMSLGGYLGGHLSYARGVGVGERTAQGGARIQHPPPT